MNLLPLVLLLALAGCSDDSGDSWPRGPDPGERGSYAVHRIDPVVIESVPYRLISTTVCAPSEDAGKTIAPGPFGLAILSPAMGIPRQRYFSYCDHLATWGFVTIVEDYSETGPLASLDDLAVDIVEIIDWAFSQSRSGLADRLDPAWIGVAGHWTGGKVGVLAALREPRIRAVVGWDPIDTGAPAVTPKLITGLGAPLAVLGETLSSTKSPPCISPKKNYSQFYPGAPPPALEVTILGADYSDWIDRPNPFQTRACGEGSVADSEVKRLTNRTTVAFFRRYLLGDETMNAYLTGPVMRLDAALGRVELRAK